MNACILVVDDDPEIVGAIAITLEREGYRVLRAYDGMEALDLALDPAVRLILIDVMMPKLHNPSWPGCPLCCGSGKSGPCR